MKRKSLASVRLKNCLVLSSLGLLTLLSSHAFAAGFKLEFQSPSVLADGGDAAVINDASTNWYNSAGLVYLPQQIVGSMIDVYSHTTFAGTTTAPAVPVFGTSAFTANGTASAHNNSYLPAMHYSLPFRHNYAFGLSVVPAWGLLEDFGDSSILRYDLQRIYTRTLDVAPSFAWKISRMWSVGAGPDFHYFTVQSRTAARVLPTTDATSRFTAEDWSYGGHVGVMFNYADTTRIGLNYRSKIVMNLNGFSEFGGDGLPALQSRNFKLQIPMPPTTSLSFYHDLNSCFAVMGTVAYDQWSVLRNFHGRNVQSLTGVIPDLVQPQDMKNTVDFSLGAHYKLNEKIMFRYSLKYQPTPTVNQNRDVNFPDAEKLGVNLGLHYQYSTKLGMDAIYAHVFTRTSPINGFNSLSGATATGNVRTSIDLAGAQIVYNI